METLTAYKRFSQNENPTNRLDVIAQSMNKVYSSKTTTIFDEFHLENDFENLGWTVLF